MNVRFLREEAARFRAMAADTDREASKPRLLAMAAEFEARAAAAAEVHESTPPNEAVEVSLKPAEGEVIKQKAGRRLTLRKKDPIC